MPKISNNRSGERRSAGLKWRPPRHDENDSDASEMLDRFEKQTAPAIAAPAAGKSSRRERSWRRSRNSRRPRHCRGAARAAATPGLPGRLQPEPGRCDGRRRDEHARTRRRVAAPARPAPASFQAACCKPNASGDSDPSRPAAAIPHQSCAGAEIAQCHPFRPQADWRGLWRRSDSPLKANCRAPSDMDSS